MKSYCGNKEAFVFVCCAPCEAEAAREIASLLGTRTRFYLADAFGSRERRALKKAAAIVPVLSASSFDAVSRVLADDAAAGKALIPVFLDGTELPAGLRLLLGSTQGVRRDDYPSAEEFGKALCRSPALDALRVSEAQKRAGRRSVAAAIALALAAALFALLLILRPFSVTRIDRSSTLGQLGLSGDPARIRTVALYGSELKKRFEDEGVYLAIAGSWSLRGQLYLPQADEQTPYGVLSDLSDFSQLTNLEELSVSGNAVSDISPLFTLKKLRKLDLSAQHYDSIPVEERPEIGLTLQGIGALESLEVLFLNENELSDEQDPTCGLSALSELPAFRTLVLDHSQTALAEALGEVPYDIVFLGATVSDYEGFCAALQTDCHQIYLSAGTRLEIPEGEELVVPKHLMVSGANVTIINRGTLRVYGWIECGLTEITNEGTIVLEAGGAFVGGMSDTVNRGSFLVEEGAWHIIERGQEFFQEEGVYRNRGTLVFGWGGTFYLRGGSAVNEGKLIVEHLAQVERPMPENWYENKLHTAEQFEGDGVIEIEEMDE